MAKRKITRIQEDRIKRLTTVALELFAESGFSGVSIKDIAKKAGIHPALIYYYYKDKADLFKGTIVRAVELAHADYMELRHVHDDPLGRLHAWLESNVRLAERYRNLVKIMLDYSRGARTRGIDTVIGDFYELEQTTLAESIRRGISEGVFKVTDPDRLAGIISVHLDGIMVASSIREDFDIDAAMNEVKGLLAVYLEPVAATATSEKISGLRIKRATKRPKSSVGARQ